jgi:hypothetical protein
MPPLRTDIAPTLYRLTSVLADLYEHFNAGLFNGELPSVPFYWQLSKGGVPFQFKRETRNCRVTGTVATLSHDDVIREMLHEVIHIANWHRGIVDCAPTQYHNRAFSTLAASVGLFVIRRRASKGYCVTQFSIDGETDYISPSDDARDRLQGVVRAIPWERLDLTTLLTTLKTHVKRREERTYLWKYVCGCSPEDGNSIRAGRGPHGHKRPLQIRCLYCNNIFKLADETGISPQKKSRGGVS